MTVKPIISKSSFGSITIDGEEHRHDVLIRLDGTVQKRKKKLSKEIYGTSHTISLAEAEQVYEEGADALLIGSGAFDRVKLSDEAAGFFAGRRVRIHVFPTPKAVERWNGMSGNVIGLFHVTC